MAACLSDEGLGFFAGLRHDYVLDAPVYRHNRIDKAASHCLRGRVHRL